MDSGQCRTLSCPPTVEFQFQPTKAYAELSPEAQLAAQVYGVAHPYEMSQDLVASLLRRAQVMCNGRFAGVQTIKRANRELREHGWVAQVHYRGVVAYDEYCLELTLAAHQAGNLAPLTEHFQRPGHYAYASIETWKQTQLRWCVAAEQFQLIDALAVDHPRHWSFLGHPLGIPFVARIPEQHRDQAIAGVLGEVIDTLQAPAAALEACQAHRSDPTEHVAEVAFIHILQGRLDEACALFDELSPAAQERKAIRTAHASVHALVATLRGDDEAASRSIEAALAAERIGTRKRNLFPPHRAFPLALLAWVRSSELTPAGELDRLLRISESLTDYS